MNITPQQAAVHLIGILERRGARFVLSTDEDDTFTVRFATAAQCAEYRDVVSALRDEIGAVLTAALVAH